MTRSQNELLRQVAELWVLPLVREGADGLKLERQLKAVVTELELQGVDQVQARSWLKRFFRDWKRNASKNFHQRLRRATPGATQPAPPPRGTPRLTLVPANEG